MMVLIFATMSLALVAVRYGPRWLAVTGLLACLALSVGLFLFEIHSPEVGFHMPWLQTEMEHPPRAVHESPRA